MTTTIITLDNVAAVVGAAVCAELGAEAEEMCGGADAIATWVLALPDDALDLERFSAGLDVLSWETAAHFEHLFGPVPGWMAG